jgi:hypothetical protein
MFISILLTSVVDGSFGSWRQPEWTKSRASWSERFISSIQIFYDPGARCSSITANMFGIENCLLYFLSTRTSISLRLLGKLENPCKINAYCMYTSFSQYLQIIIIIHILFRAPHELHSDWEHAIWALARNGVEAYALRRGGLEPLQKTWVRMERVSTTRVVANTVRSVPNLGMSVRVANLALYSQLLTLGFA